MFKHGDGDFREEHEFPLLAVIGIFVIFLLAAAGSLIPPLIVRYFPKYDLENKIYFRLLSGFAAGVVVGVGFMHSVPEGFENFETGFALLTEQEHDHDHDHYYEGGDGGDGGEEETNPAYDYPWGAFVVMMGAFLTYLVEHLVEHATGHTHSHSASTVIKKETTSGGSDIELSKDESEAIEEEDVMYTAEMYVLLAGLSFHSFFVGLALGVAENDLGLFIAIIAHQFFEGIAFGAHVARARVATWKIWFLDLLFSFSTPVGIAIGIGIAQSLHTSAISYAFVNAFFECLSGGILIYVGLVHMMREEFTRFKCTHSKGIQAAIFIGFALGIAVMSIIGIWA